MISSSTIIDNYRLRTALGHGPLGNVYLAQDTMFTNRLVAIKLLNAPPLNSVKEHDRFLQEAHVLELLRHQYILHIHDAGIYEKTPFLVSSYVTGGSLRQRLGQNVAAPMLIEESLKILPQIGHALYHAHKQNIIHGNLKPENILFTPQGDALLADFGMAVTQEWQTSDYMAPEQFKGIVSKESDQYALGCIAYELFTGQHPFNRYDPKALMFQHINENPLPPSLLHHAIPSSIEQAILKAMAKRPQDRHANMKAFITALCTPPDIPNIQSFVPTSTRPVSSLLTDSASRENTVKQVPFPPTSVNTEPIGNHSIYAPAVTNTTGKTTPTQRQPAWFLIAAIVSLVLLIVGGSLWHLLPVLLKNGSTHQAGSNTFNPLPSSATISITPQSKTLKNSYTILAVVGTPNLARHEVAARYLSATQSQPQTVQATGKTSSPAVQASAVITLTNNANTDQTVPAGTIFSYVPGNGSSQLEATTDTTVVAPAWNIFIGPEPVNVSAHAVTAGAVGNTITSLRCNCRNITVDVPTPFSGGRDAQNTPFIQQSDINGATASLTASLTPTVQSLLQAQVHTNEHLINVPVCPPTASSNHNAGDKVTSATITVTVTCTGMVYDQQAAQAIATILLKNDATSHPNATYTLTGNTAATITQAAITDAQKGIITLSVQAQSTGIFQFSDTQKRNLVALIAGKTKQDAQKLLLQQPGVCQITITYSNSTMTTLPSNQRNITINVSNM